MRGGQMPVMPAPEKRPPPDRPARWALAALAAGACGVQLDAFALNPALPAVRDELHGSASAPLDRQRLSAPPVP